MLSQKWKQLLIDNRGHLLEAINVKKEGFWATLIEMGVITDEDQEIMTVSAIYCDIKLHQIYYEF